MRNAMNVSKMNLLLMCWCSHCESLWNWYQDLTPESGNCDPLCSVDETSSEDFEGNYQPKTDLLKAVAILAAAATGAVAINHSWVAANQVRQSLLPDFTYNKGHAFGETYLDMLDSNSFIFISHLIAGSCNGIAICDRICRHHIWRISSV